MTAIYQQINLYQPIFRKQRQIFSAITMLQSIAVVAVALLGIYAYGLAQVTNLEGEIVQLEGREKALTTQLARIDPSFGANQRAVTAEEIARLNATLVDQQRLIDVLREQPLGSGGGFSSYLSALGRQRTAELWLTRFAIDGASGAIELEGRSTRAELVPEYLSKLGGEPVLATQEFDRFEVGRDEELRESTFRVTSRKLAPREGAERL